MHLEIVNNDENTTIYNERQGQRIKNMLQRKRFFQKVMIDEKEGKNQKAQGFIMNSKTVQ